jgi:hypothetical protein
MRFIRPYSLIITLGLMGCLEPYAIPDDPTFLDPLVVDGFIDAVQRKATVILSRTQHVAADTAYTKETDATVRIATSTGELLLLPELEPGRYELSNVPIDFIAKYTLHIETSDGVTFTSDQITLQKTPTIDSISWAAAPGDQYLDIKVSTEDPAIGAKYFLWSFEETWVYRSRFKSYMKWVGDTPVVRMPEEDVHTCYNSYKSSNILLANNQHLDRPVISDFVINKIPLGSQKIQERYSIIVTQRVLSAEEYKFQSDLKRTTESLGGLFDPITGYVEGNVHQDNDKQAFVLGFFSGGETQSKRVFIEYKDLPDQLKAISHPFLCSESRTCSVFMDARGNNSLPCEFLEDIGSATTGIIAAINNQRLNIPEFYVYAPLECTDCTIQGGVVTRPSFWPSHWQ